MLNTEFRILNRNNIIQTFVGISFSSTLKIQYGVKNPTWFLILHSSVKEFFLHVLHGETGSWDQGTGNAREQ